MAIIPLATEKILQSGLVGTYTGSLSVANSYHVKNNGRVFLHFKKSEAVDAVVTIETPITVGGLAVAEQTVTIPATTGDKFVGPFPKNIFNDGDGEIIFSADNIAGLTVACLEL